MTLLLVEALCLGGLWLRGVTHGNNAEKSAHGPLFAVRDLLTARSEHSSLDVQRRHSNPSERTCLSTEGGALVAHHTHLPASNRTGSWPMGVARRLWDVGPRIPAPARSAGKQVLQCPRSVWKSLLARFRRARAVSSWFRRGARKKAASSSIRASSAALEPRFLPVPGRIMFIERTPQPSVRG